MQQPRRRFGQHFLIDQHVIASIHDVLNIATTDQVIEIGPGNGVLTTGLNEATPSLVAVEIDRGLLRLLKSRFRNIKFIEADVLRIDDATFDGTRVVGNLPYNISTPLLGKLIRNERIVDMHFMLQAEVVDRLTAQPSTKDWGRLSVKVQYHCRVDRLFDVDCQAFRPVPQVDSAFVRLQPLSSKLALQNEGLFDVVLRAAFNKRRKKISNSMKTFKVDWDAVNVDPTLRADDVSLDQFVLLANSLKQPDS